MVTMTGQVWVNPRQPQTLYIAQLLLYWRGAFAVLFTMLSQAPRYSIVGGSQLGAIFLLLDTIGMLAGGFGIANERRWGYWIGVTAATAPLLLRILDLLNGTSGALLRNPISLLFDIALVALLVHPMSRQYKRIWFR